MTKHTLPHSMSPYHKLTAQDNTNPPAGSRWHTQWTPQDKSLHTLLSFLLAYWTPTTTPYWTPPPPPPPPPINGRLTLTPPPPPPPPKTCHHTLCYLPTASCWHTLTPTHPPKTDMATTPQNPMKQGKDVNYIMANNEQINHDRESRIWNGKPPPHSSLMQWGFLQLQKWSVKLTNQQSLIT